MKFADLKYFVRKFLRLPSIISTWVSRGKASNLMGQIKLIWVACEYIISLLRVIHRPACLDNTSTTYAKIVNIGILNKIYRRKIASIWKFKIKHYSSKYFISKLLTWWKCPFQGFHIEPWVMSLCAIFSLRFYFVQCEVFTVKYGVKSGKVHIAKLSKTWRI